MQPQTYVVKLSVFSITIINVFIDNFFKIATLNKINLHTYIYEYMCKF